MRAVRIATTGAGAVVGVVAWITLVPLFDLLRSVVRAVTAAAIPKKCATAESHLPATIDPPAVGEARVDRAA